MEAIYKWCGWRLLRSAMVAGMLLAGGVVWAANTAITDEGRDPDPYKDKPGKTEPDKGLVELDNQVFREWVPVAGTPYLLNYTSWRAVGNRQAYVLDIPLYPARLFKEVWRSEVTIWAPSGEHVFSAGWPNVPYRYIYVWGGLDAGSNVVTGTHEVVYRVGLTTLAGWYSHAWRGGAWHPAELSELHPERERASTGVGTRRSPFRPPRANAAERWGRKRRRWGERW